MAFLKLQKSNAIVWFDTHLSIASLWIPTACGQIAERRIEWAAWCSKGVARLVINLLGRGDVQLSQGGLQVRVHLKVQQGLQENIWKYILWQRGLITWEMAFSTSSGSSLLALMIFPLVRAMSTIFSEIYKYKIIWSNISWQFHSAL